MNKELLEVLKSNNAPIFTWESGLNTSNQDVLNFYTKNTEFYAWVSKDNHLHLVSLDGESAITTSSVIKLEKKGGYRRIETRNTVYHLWKVDTQAVCPTMATIPVESVIPATPTVPIFTEPKLVEIKSIDVKEVYHRICAQYPYACYGSFCSAFSDAKRDGFITDDEYQAAHVYYGRLWFYAGD